MLGQVLAGDLQRRLTQADGEQVLLALGADLGHVGERDGVEATPRALAVGLERCLVGDDRPVGVAQAVMHRGDRVEQVAEIAQIRARPVQLQRLEEVLQRLRVVAGMVMHDADEVQRPDLDDRRRATPGQVSRLEGQTERLVELTEPIGDAGEPIQRLGFARLIAVRARQNTGLLHQRPRPDEVVGLGRARLIE